MATMHQIEIHVVIDADGDYRIGMSIDEANEAYNETVGGDCPKRHLHIVLQVPAPEVIRLCAIVPSCQPIDLPITMTIEG